MTAGWQRRAAVENADVIQPQKAPFEQVLTETIFTVHPPTEVQHEFGKRSFEKIHIARTLKGLLGAIQKDGSPRMHRRIHITEIPLVRGNLTCGVQKEFLQHQV